MAATMTKRILAPPSRCAGRSLAPCSGRPCRGPAFTIASPSRQPTDDSDETQAPLYDAGPSRHRPCLVLSVLNWGLALFTAWCASDGDDLETPYRDGCSAFISVPASLWAVLYLIMLLEAFASHTRRYIANVRSIDEVVAMLDRVRASPPVLCLHLECYHFGAQRSAGAARAARSSPLSPRTAAPCVQRRAVARSPTRAPTAAARRPRTAPRSRW